MELIRSLLGIGVSKNDAGIVFLILLATININLFTDDHVFAITLSVTAVIAI